MDTSRWVPGEPVPPGAAEDGAQRSRSLLVTADPVLLDDLLRLCGAAGAQPHLAADAGSARRRWTGPAMVVVGADLVDGLLRLGLPRRPGVVLVATDLDEAGVWDQAAALGAEAVVHLPDAQPWLADRLGDAVEGPGAGGAVVAVIGGRGGAGATVLAAALAATAATGGVPTMLFDCDPVGSGIDMVLGLEDAPGLRWPDLTAAAGRLAAAALRDALPSRGALSVLSGARDEPDPLPADAVRAVLRAARSAHELVVVDLPRRVDAALEVVLSVATQSLLVVPAEVRATAAAARLAQALGGLTGDLQAVVRGPAPSGLTGELVASSLGLPLAGWLDADPDVVRCLEQGRPPDVGPRTALGALCRRLVADLPLTRRPAA